MSRRPSARRCAIGVTAVAAALLLDVTAGAASVTGAASVLPAPTTIDATGATDVTAPLNAFLARVPAGATVSFPHDARYRVEGTLVLAGRRDVTIEGNGATFFASTDGAGVPPPRGGGRASWPRLRQQWRIRGGSGITLHDLTVRGANPHGGASAAAYVPALEGQAGIAIQRVTGVILDSVHVSDTYGDSVYVVGGSVNVMIRNSTLERSGRQGVAVVNAQHVTVENNTVRDVARSVFDLEPPGRSVVRDIHLRDNTVGDYRNFLLSAGGGGPGVADIWLEGNRVDGGHGVSVFAGVEGPQRSGYHVIDNTGTGAQRAPAGTGRSGLLQLLNLRQVEVRGNRQPVAGVPALSLDRVCGLSVSGNQFPGASAEQQVVAPCGAQATTTTRADAPPASGAPARAAPGAGGDGSDDTASLVLVGLGGFAAGLGAAAVAVLGWRRRRSRSSG